MKLTSTALALALAAIAAPAAAQYNQPAPQPQQTATQPAAAEEGQQQQAGVTVSRGAEKPLRALQEAVDANDVANIPARVAAAQAAVKTAEDRYMLAALQYKAALATKDNAAKAAAIEGIIASGKAQGSQLPSLYADLANTYTALQQRDRAAATLKKLLELDPNNVEAAIVLANSLKAQGRAAEGVGQLQAAIAKGAAAGRVDERLYKQAVQLAYDAQSPAAISIARDWVSAYPTPANWKNALAIYRRLGPDDDSAVLDVLRLQRAVGALDSDGDLHRYAFIAVNKGYAGEAKLMIDEAIAARKTDPNKKLIKDIVAESTQKAAGDKAEMAESAKLALAGSEARRALTAGDAYYGYGDYLKAAELYRAALTKSGADKDLINLHLGMALARSGDKAGATAALNAVGGPRAELAKYWLVYLKTRA